MSGNDGTVKTRSEIIRQKRERAARAAEDADRDAMGPAWDAAMKESKKIFDRNNALAELFTDMQMWCHREGLNWLDKAYPAWSELTGCDEDDQEPIDEWNARYGYLSHEMSAVAKPASTTARAFPVSTVSQRFLAEAARASAAASAAEPLPGQVE